MTKPEEELTFYSDNSGVRVTNTRLIIGSSTYAMGNIASVTTVTTKPNRLRAVTVMVVATLGLMLVGRQLSEKDFGHFLYVILSWIFVMGVCVLWLIVVKSKYHVRISSASGETNALSSRQKDYIEKVVQAINEAIIKRG